MTRSLSLVFLVVYLGLFALTGCAAERAYEVNGRVAGFSDDPHTLIVEHENIPGLMPAMTMPFMVASSSLVDSLAVGDPIRFTFIVTPDSTWISTLRLLPDSAVAVHPAGTPDPYFEGSSNPSLLDQGDALPPATLTDQDGASFDLANFEGQALLLTFIYTRCPLPDYCPRISGNFQTLAPRFAAQYEDRVHLLSISFDPAFDTPETLHAYAKRYTSTTEHWTFATGTPEQIAMLAGRFGVFYEASGQEFDHNLTTALIDPTGHIFRLWRGTSWQPEDVEQAVAEMLSEES